MNDNVIDFRKREEKSAFKPIDFKYNREKLSDLIWEDLHKANPIEEGAYNMFIKWTVEHGAFVEITGTVTRK